MAARRPSYAPDHVMCDVCSLRCGEESRYSPCGHNFCGLCVFRHIDGVLQEEADPEPKGADPKGVDSTQTTKVQLKGEKDEKVRSQEQEEQLDKDQTEHDENRKLSRWCPICKVETSMLNSAKTKKKKTMRVYKMSCQVCYLQPWTQRCGHCMQNVCADCKQKHVEADEVRSEVVSQMNDIRQGALELQRLCAHEGEKRGAVTSLPEQDKFMIGLYERYEHLVKAIDRFDKQVL